MAIIFNESGINVTECSDKTKDIFIRLEDINWEHIESINIDVSGIYIERPYGYGTNDVNIKRWD